MATQAQIEANARNATKSSGPRTQEGKARTRRNATRHGLCSSMALMNNEELMDQDFQLLLADLREEHQPDGPTEDILVYKMAESFFFSNRAQVLLAERLDFNNGEDDSKQVSLMLRYHTTADRAFTKNLNELRKLKKERQKDEIGSVSQDAQTQPPEDREAAPSGTPQPVEIQPNGIQAPEKVAPTIAVTIGAPPRAG